MGYKVAVIGATGNVGREMLNILAEREFPADEVFAIASRRSMGVEVSYGDHRLKCRDLEQFDFRGVDFALMSAGSAVSKEWSPKIGAQGCVVIDNSSLLALRSGRAADRARGERRRGRGLHQEEHHRQSELLDRPARRRAEAAARRWPRSSASSSRPTSRSPAPARRRWTSCGTRPRASSSPIRPTPKTFTKQIAFNVIPHIDVFMEDGQTKEEWKMAVETKKILDPKIKLTATCVRVPVFVGHSEAVNVEFEEPITAAEARKILREAPGVLVVDKRENGGYVTPVECVGDYATFVSRIREDQTIDNGLSFWVVSDNLRKGAALNTVQIAELIVNRNLLDKAA